MKTPTTVPEVIGQLLTGQTYVTSPDVATGAHVTRQAAHYHLRQMTEDGVLVSEGSRRSSHYHLKARCVPRETTGADSEPH